VRWGNGKTIVAVDENDLNGYFPRAEWTGGARTHSHNYAIKLANWYGTCNSEGAPGTGAYNYQTSQYSSWVNQGSTTVNVNNALQTASTSRTPAMQYSEGITPSQNNWAPCICCYLWKRTA